jgi:hypothetical protein
MRATTLSNPNQTMYSSCTRLLLCGETMVIDDSTFMTGSIINMCTKCIAIWSCFAHTFISLHSLVRWLQRYKQPPIVFTWLDGVLIMGHEDASAEFGCKSYWASCYALVRVWWLIDTPWWLYVYLNGSTLNTPKCMSCSHFHAVAFIVYQVTAELHASASRLLLWWRRFGWGTREICGPPFIFFDAKLFEGCNPPRNNGESRCFVFQYLLDSWSSMHTCLSSFQECIRERTTRCGDLFRCWLWVQERTDSSHVERVFTTRCSFSRKLYFQDVQCQ